MQRAESLFDARREIYHNGCITVPLLEERPVPTAMTLKNIPDDVYDRLKAAAVTHHRSINKEAIACLERALQEPEANVGERLARIRELRASLKPRQFKSRDILRAIEQGRP